ncbi:MAG: tetraacyldisaccharide 4'-kinase [Bacteroidota bacterium]
MKIIRYILFPVVPIYYLVTWLRNILYDRGIKSSNSYDSPVICVGNLSTGGTGKTPMIEYLVRVLSGEYGVATLSRGYKRSTKGFILASDKDNAKTIGDEPLQFYKKFKTVRVAVDANRQEGISKLLSLDPKPEVILLDDAFQHRKVNASLNIILTSYHNLFYKDFVLPTGNLREPRSGYKRADIIVVTKGPVYLDDDTKKRISNRIKPLEGQSVFFSHISYAENVHSENSKLPLATLPFFTLVTGIANDKPLVNHLKSLGLDFEHLSFGDHHNFKAKDIQELTAKSLVVTTEKDFVRLASHTELSNILFYLPIELVIENAEAFNALIEEAVN